MKRRPIKQLQADLEKIQYEIAGYIDARESDYDERTEAWQDSEKGVTHQKKTEVLIEAQSNLDDAGACLLDFLEP